jgi:two-component system alkaline phosphatase synthesis response regulator PhoP/two-component system response regulator VicR
MATTLIADDESPIVGVPQMVLEQEGYRVLGAYEGREALRLAREQSPDLVLADAMMPYLGGAELATALAADPGTRDTPVILMSAGVQPATPPGRTVAFLAKPFALERVVALIARHLVA